MRQGLLGGDYKFQAGRKLIKRIFLYSERNRAKSHRTLIWDFVTFFKEKGREEVREMKVRKEVVMVKQSITVYVAEDGREFDTKEECELHEKRMKREALVEKAKKFCVQGLKNVMPLVNQQTSEESVYDWFHVKDREMFLFLKELFRLDGEYNGNYPALLCVEFVDEEYGTDAYLYTMEDCINSTKDFWKKFGVELDIEQRQIKTEDISEKGEKLTWDEIYERAEGKPFLHSLLKAKDEARHQVRCFAMEIGAPDLEEAECPEDEVEQYCNAWNLLFDERGNIVSMKLPDAAEKMATDTAESR